MFYNYHFHDMSIVTTDENVRTLWGNISKILQTLRWSCTIDPVNYQNSNPRPNPTCVYDKNNKHKNNFKIQTRA